MAKLRTLIASNDRTFRSLLAGYVQLLDPCIDLVGEATTTAEALLAMRDQPLDLVLLDLSLQPGNALGLIDQIWDITTAAVVVIGDQPAAEYRDAAIAAGALDYVDVFELSTTLPAALGRDPKLIELCEPLRQADEWTPPEETPRTGPTGPKRCLFTAWQYVHFVLALVIGAMFLARVQTPGARWRLVLLLCIVSVAVLEVRQLATARRAEEFPEYR